MISILGGAVDTLVVVLSTLDASQFRKLAVEGDNRNAKIDGKPHETGSTHNNDRIYWADRI